MKHVGPVRRALGITTIMNILGPVTNPAGAKRQVVGVADPGLLALVPDALRALGHVRALVVHGVVGVDEVSPAGVTRVSELADGEILEYEITPADVGLEDVRVEALAGGEPERNAAMIEAILSGEQGPTRSAVVMNAAAALIAADAADSWERGARMAEASLDEGKAAEALERLRRATASS
jgi:anthranilate phosphoribosyltransferase